MVEALLMGPALGGLSAMGTGKLKASVDGRDYDNKLRDYMIGSSLATTGTAGGVILENMLPRSSMGKTKLSKALSLARDLAPMAGTIIAPSVYGYLANNE